jgi:hypothetical protein
MKLERKFTRRGELMMVGTLEGVSAAAVGASPGSPSALASGSAAGASAGSSRLAFSFGPGLLAWGLGGLPFGFGNAHEAGAEVHSKGRADGGRNARGGQCRGCWGLARFPFGFGLGVGCWGALQLPAEIGQFDFQPSDEAAELISLGFQGGQSSLGTRGAALSLYRYLLSEPGEFLVHPPIGCVGCGLGAGRGGGD